MHEHLRDLNVNLGEGRMVEASRHAASLVAAGSLLGLLQQNPEIWLKGDPGDDAAGAAIAEAIERRNAARKSRDFAAADRIRDRLQAAGWVVEDTSGGTKIHR